jgi:hypothetical protein
MPDVVDMIQGERSSANSSLTATLMSASPYVPYQAYKVRCRVPPRRLVNIRKSRRDILAVSPIAG